MPRKIRQLKAELKVAGFVELKGRGKGSHTIWEHLDSATTVTISGQNGDDAAPYQEQQLRAAIAQARQAEHHRS
jgi:predicted RNA binding protein YcfA (HicA-like mRNA interferase family)